jgi:magnesium chelatase family protein
VSGLECAWHNLHHTDILLRAIEAALAGNHSLRVLGHPSAGKDDFDTLYRFLLARGSNTVNNSFSNTWGWTVTCPCGYCGDPTHECTCTPSRVERWRRRLARHHFDLSLVVAIPRARDLVFVDRARKGQCEPLSRVLSRVEAAREARGAIPLDLDPAGTQLLRVAVDRLGFSLNQRDRVMKVAQTIAALSNSNVIRAAHLAEAIQYQWWV